MLGGLGAVARGAKSVLGDRRGAGSRPRIRLLLEPVVEPRHRDITCDSGLVARQRGDVTGMRSAIALVGGLQPGCRRCLTLARGPSAEVPADVVIVRIDAMHEVAIARSLIAIRRVLVAISTRLVAVGAGLIGIGQRLIAVCERLLAVCERLLVAERARGAFLWSFDRSVGGDIHRTIA